MSDDTKTRRQEQRRKRETLSRKYIYEYLSSNPCSTCGESNPVVLEFDHLDRKKKRGNVSDMVKYSLSSVIKEIEKCRVLCANCHRIHTAEQMGWYSSFLGDLKAT